MMRPSLSFSTKMFFISWSNYLPKMIDKSQVVWKISKRGGGESWGMEDIKEGGGESWGMEDIKEGGGGES